MRYTTERERKKGERKGGVASRRFSIPKYQQKRGQSRRCPQRSIETQTHAVFRIVVATCHTVSGRASHSPTLNYAHACVCLPPSKKRNGTAAARMRQLAALHLPLPTEAHVTSLSVFLVSVRNGSRVLLYIRRAHRWLSHPAATLAAYRLGAAVGEHT